jgi:hypothetical protein
MRLARPRDNQQRRPDKTGEALAFVLLLATCLLILLAILFGGVATGWNLWTVPQATHDLRAVRVGTPTIDPRFTR